MLACMSLVRGISISGLVTQHTHACFEFEPQAICLILFEGIGVATG